MSGKKTTNKITAKGTKGGNRISEGGTSRAAGEGSGAETLAMARVRAPPGNARKERRSCLPWGKLLAEPVTQQKQRHGVIERDHELEKSEPGNRARQDQPDGVKADKVESMN